MKRKTNYINRFTNAYIKIVKATASLIFKGIAVVAMCGVIGCLVLGTEANYSTARVKEKLSTMDKVVKGIGTVTQIVKAIK